MMSNDIALSFDKAEYYTLQEAADYLNRKHKITNITLLKLLKKSISYDANIYIFAKGFYLTGDFNFEFCPELINSLENGIGVEEFRETLRNCIDEIHDYLSYRISTHGSLLKIISLSHIALQGNFNSTDLAELCIFKDAKNAENLDSEIDDIFCQHLFNKKKPLRK